MRFQFNEMIRFIGILQKYNDNYVHKHITKVITVIHYNIIDYVIDAIDIYTNNYTIDTREDCFRINSQRR